MTKRARNIIKGMGSTFDIMPSVTIRIRNAYSGEFVHCDPIPPGPQKDARAIIIMAESEMAHRHEMERKGLDASIEMGRKGYLERRIGQIFGLIVGLMVILSGAYCIIKGHPVAGGFIGGGGVVGLVSAFIYGRKTESDKPTR